MSDTELQRLELWLLARDPMGANNRTPSETVDVVLQELNRLDAVDSVRVGLQTVIPMVERTVAAFGELLRANPGLVEKIVTNAQAAKASRSAAVAGPEVSFNLEDRVWRVVETDNYGGDYPNESFHGPWLTAEAAKQVAGIFNNGSRNASRYFVVKHYTYKLQPGFEP